MSAPFQFSRFFCRPSTTPKSLRRVLISFSISHSPALGIRSWTLLLGNFPSRRTRSASKWAPVPAVRYTSNRPRAWSAPLPPLTPAGHRPWLGRLSIQRSSLGSRRGYQHDIDASVPRLDATNSLVVIFSPSSHLNPSPLENHSNRTSTEKAKRRKEKPLVVSRHGSLPASPTARPPTNTCAAAFGQREEQTSGPQPLDVAVGLLQEAAPVTR